MSTLQVSLALERLSRPVLLREVRQHQDLPRGTHEKAARLLAPKLTIPDSVIAADIADVNRDLFPTGGWLNGGEVPSEDSLAGRIIDGTGSGGFARLMEQRGDLAEQLGAATIQLIEDINFKLYQGLSYADTRGRQNWIAVDHLSGIVNRLDLLNQVPQEVLDDTGWDPQETIDSVTSYATLVLAKTYARLHPPRQSNDPTGLHS